MSTVILGHIVGGDYKAGMFIESTNIPKIIFDAIYLFHMSLYFRISDFVFLHAYLVGQTG